MKKRILQSFNDLVKNNKQEIEMDPQELDRIEKKIDDKHTKPQTVIKKRII
jgi:hypothetical protein